MEEFARRKRSVVPRAAAVAGEESIERATEDPEASAQLPLESFRPYLKRAAKRWLGPDDASDLAQSTLRRAVGRFEGFRPRHDRAVQAWLDRILLNTVRERIRARRALKRGGGLAPVSIEDHPEPAKDTHSADRAPDTIANDELIGLVWKALGEDDRRLLHLRHYDEASWAEIAERLGIVSAEAARKRHGAIVARLRTQFPAERG
jgi:RNA polymerase sigma factor (sigma-70 family)